MTKQEEIREGLEGEIQTSLVFYKELIANNQLYDAKDLDKRLASSILAYLHSQGVVIKVEGNWIDVSERLPAGQWNVNHPQLSEEVLIANSCSINIGFYNRDDGTWYVDEPAKEEWIDKITHWRPLPINPHNQAMSLTGCCCTESLIEETANA